MKVIQSKKKFNISINGKKINIRKKAMFIVPDWLVVQMYKSNPTSFTKAQNVYDILEKFKYFDSRTDNKSEVILIRSGGIGDLIALSSLCKRVYELTNKKVYFITQDKYLDLFDVAMPNYIKPIRFMDEIKFKPGLEKNYKVIFFEGVIENSTKNQYELMFEKVNDEFKEKYGRPQLDKEKASKKLKRSEYLDENNFNVLLNPKSTSIIRSMPIEDMYKIAKEAFKDIPNVKFHVHAVNLKKPDIEYIKNNNIDINVISKAKCSTLKHYLSDVYNVDYLISIDSAAVHFREGLEKKGIAFYASFPTDARTKYYKYVKTVDLPKKCPNQPCFIHTKKPLETCDVALNEMKEGRYSKEYRESYSPCHTSVYNPDIIDFCVNEIKSDIKNM